jgi:ketosteroid isomerase-like protein
LHITVVGQTAIATMVFKTKGTDAKGKPMEYNARWADTYVKMPNGKWQCVLSQGSDLKKLTVGPGQSAAASLGG